MHQEQAADLETASQNLQHTLSQAAAALPAQVIRARRPGTSQGILGLVAEQNACRRAGDYENEQK
eukprot:3013897-Pyramimonas_sp.AAC.1